MRNFISTAVLLAVCCTTFGQNANFKECPKGYKPEHFIDSVFYYGSVLQKSLSISEGYLNYNILDNDIVFIDDNNKLKKLVNLTDYIQITFGKHSFIPINNTAVAEVIKTYKNGVILLYERKMFIKEKKIGAYGISNETSSNMKVKNYDDRGNNVTLNTSNEKEIIHNNKFYVRINGKIKTIGTMKKLKKIFPDKAEIIIDEFNKRIEGETEVEKYTRIINLCCDE